MDRNLALEMIRVTEAAALASARWLGKGDSPAATAAATEAMQIVLGSLNFKGKIIIGCGDKDNTKHLYCGQIVGNGSEPIVDIAIDPLESVNSVAYGRPNAMAVVAIAEKDCLLNFPEKTYMEKLAVGPEAVGKIDINRPLEDNIKAVADAKNYSLSDLTIAILDRERHLELINKIRSLGPRLHLIPDGDVSAAIATALPGTGIDMLVGTGGAVEGVMAAAAMRCLGGEIQGKIRDNKIKHEYSASKDVVYNTGDMASGYNIMFAATGITDGDLLNGVRYRKDGATTNSLVLRAISQTRRFVVTEHYFDNQPQY